jgi:hypothetical protein
VSPTKLTKLQIRSVDSVDRGAGVGCRVLIRKRLNEEENKMSDIGVVSIAKRAATAIAKGELDPQTSAKLFQRIALEEFPESKTLGEAMEKLRKTVHGQDWLNAQLQRDYENMQRAGALGTHVPVVKAHGNPASRQSEYETPDTEEADETPHIGEDDEPFDQKVERLMKERNISRDAAITLIYRAEKVAKGLSW